MNEGEARSDEPDDDDASVRELLKGSRDGGETPNVDVLEGVQKRLRERSGGKFYADGWSTAREPPVATFLVTSVLMLVIVAITYAVLGPLRGQVESVPMEPAPVEVVAPAPSP